MLKSSEIPDQTNKSSKKKRTMGHFLAKDINEKKKLLLAQKKFLQETCHNLEEMNATDDPYAVIDFLGSFSSNTALSIIMQNWPKPVIERLQQFFISILSDTLQKQVKDIDTLLAITKEDNDLRVSFYQLIYNLWDIKATTQDIYVREFDQQYLPDVKKLTKLLRSNPSFLFTQILDDKEIFFNYIFALAKCVTHHMLIRPFLDDIQICLRTFTMSLKNMKLIKAKVSALINAELQLILDENIHQQIIEKYGSTGQYLARHMTPLIRELKSKAMEFKSEKKQNKFFKKINEKFSDIVEQLEAPLLWHTKFKDRIEILETLSSSLFNFYSSTCNSICTQLGKEQKSSAKQRAKPKTTKNTEKKPEEATKEPSRTVTIDPLDDKQNQLEDESQAVVSEQEIIKQKTLADYYAQQKPGYSFSTHTYSFDSKREKTKARTARIAMIKEFIAEPHLSFKFAQLDSIIKFFGGYIVNKNGGSHCTVYLPKRDGSEIAIGKVVKHKNSDSKLTRNLARYFVELFKDAGYVSAPKLTKNQRKKLKQNKNK